MPLGDARSTDIWSLFETPRAAVRIDVRWLRERSYRKEEERAMSNENRLRRQNGIVAGVCGGLAEFTGIHVFWFRLAFLILMLPGGLPGVVPYLILWIIIPKKR